MHDVCAARDVLNDYVELGMAQAEMEGEIEAQTGVLLDAVQACRKVVRSY